MSFYSYICAIIHFEKADMKSQEKMVIFDNLINTENISFPFPISPLSQEIVRTPENERKHCHVTCLIVPIIEGNKILVIDKAEKTKLKNPKKYRLNFRYLDIIGGHFTSALIPPGELKLAKLTYKTALRQAFRELSEELKLRKEDGISFVQEDLVFLGFCPYQSDSNKELSLVFGLALGYPVEYYEVFDDAIINGKKKNIRLAPPKAYSYNELVTLWEEREKNKDSYEIQDGLGRLLDRGDLPEMIGKIEFPVRHATRINFSTSLSSEVKPITGSLKDFDIDLPITDLLRGYSKEGNRYVCMGCEFISINEHDVKSHWERYHNSDRESRFINLLNSSIADLSYIEKLVCYRIYLGMSNKEIAEELNIPAVTTVNSIRQRFKGFYERSKIMLLLCDMLPPFKRNKKTVREELIPSLNPETLHIENFYTKEEIHSREIAALHPTVILVLARNDENGWTFLVKDKANMIASLTGGLVKDMYGRMLDFCGGHVEICDLEITETGKATHDRKRFIGKPISGAYGKTAKRELIEEVSLRGGADIDPDRLIEFCDIKYAGPTFLGWNNEISKIYLYILYDVPAKNVRTYDVWEDPFTGKKVRKEYVCEFKTLPELMRIYDEDKSNYMDGALRVLEKLRSEPEVEKHLFNILDEEMEASKSESNITES